MNPRKAGGSLSGNPYSRGMKFTRITILYKYSGKEGSKTSFTSISQAFSDESYSFLNRKYNSFALSCEDGGNQKQVFTKISQRNLEVSPEPWDHNYCRMSSKLNEHGGRSAVKNLKIPFRE